MGKYSDLEIAKRIRKEVLRLRRNIRDFCKDKDLAKDILQKAEGLIHRAAYMRVTLEDWEADIIENGIVEMFTQSENTPPYERERPVARLYNTMNKNYQSIIKQLSDLMPKIEVKQGDDGFEDFLMRK